MSKLLLSLDADFTGINKDNRITDEPHSLNTKIDVRAVVPGYGLFYGDSVVMRDGATVLRRGKDFQLIELHSDLSVKTGKEVFAAILVFNTKIGPDITITYQAVGGEWSTNNKALINIYESFLKDDRPVYWNNIIDKPYEFPPTAHNHILDDVVGWEPVIYALERINASLRYGNVDILMAVVNGLMNRFYCRESSKAVSSDKNMQYDSFLYHMSKRKLLSKAWIDVENCEWVGGRMANIIIDTSDYKTCDRFWWTIYKQNGSPLNIPFVRNGVVRGNGSLVKIPIYVPSNHQHEKEVFYIGLETEESRRMFLGDILKDGVNLPDWGPVTKPSQTKSTSINWDESGPENVKTVSDELAWEIVDYFKDDFRKQLRMDGTGISHNGELFSYPGDKSSNTKLTSEWFVYVDGIRYHADLYVTPKLPFKDEFEGVDLSEPVAREWLYVPGSGVGGRIKKSSMSTGKPYESVLDSFYDQFVADLQMEGHGYYLGQYKFSYPYTELDEYALSSKWKIFKKDLSWIAQLMVFPSNGEPGVEAKPGENNYTFWSDVDFSKPHMEVEMYVEDVVSEGCDYSDDVMSNQDVIQSMGEDFLPIPYWMRRRFKDEYDATTYRIVVVDPLKAFSSYALMATMSNPSDSDDFTTPGEADTSELNQILYVSEHESMFVYE